MDDLDCRGGETNLLHCPFGGWGNHQCNHSEDVIVTCSGEPEPVVHEEKNYILSDDGAYKMNNIEISEGMVFGRVEYSYNGHWGTVCDDAFDRDEAGVFCRSLGLSPVGAQTVNVPQGSEDMPIWMTGLNCTGDELGIVECIDKKPFGEHDCEHHEDVGVACSLSAAPATTGHCQYPGMGDAEQVEL